MSAPIPPDLDLPRNDSPRRVNDHFVNLTAHELRNPLRALALDAEYLARHLEGDHLPPVEPTELTDIARRMATAARRMSEQVNDLLALATGDHSPTEPELVELEPLVGEVLAEFEDKLRRIGATVHVDLLPAVMGGKPQLRMLFRNLVSNAIRHRHPDRPLQLAIRTKTYGLDDGGRLLYLAVADNGGGINPAEQHRIFEPYAQASERSDGMGLGLAICDRIVGRMGGTIHVESDGETGSTFVILIHEDQTVHVSPSAHYPSSQWRGQPQT